MFEGARNRLDLGRERRIRSRSDFDRIQRVGKKVHTRHFIVAVRPFDGPVERRLGITVTKKIGPAVLRNRIKRIVREVFRRNQSRFPRSCDLVFIAKRGAGELDYREALREISRAAAAMQQALDACSAVEGRA